MSRLSAHPRMWRQQTHWTAFRHWSTDPWSRRRMQTTSLVIACTRPCANMPLSSCERLARRSEERRVGKECRCRIVPNDYIKNSERSAIVELVARNKVPASYKFRGYVAVVGMAC